MKFVNWRMQNKISCLLIPAALFLFSCKNEVKPDTQGFNKELDSFFQQMIKPDGPGIAVLVGKPGTPAIYSKGFGLADMVTKAPITPGTVFNLGSVSKTFVAFGILKLQEQGKLSIEDPISKYFPGFKHPEMVKDIRIKHLLSHTSGLPDNRPVQRDSIFFLTAKDAENFAPILQNDSLLFQPGERYEYSNPAFNGLALIIEQITGRPWQRFIEREIFAASGMTNSVITDGSIPRNGVSHGYQMVNGNWEEYDYLEYPTFCASGNGGVWSSVEELLKYEEAIQKHVFLKEETIKLSRTVFLPPNWKSNQAPFIGYCWFIENNNGQAMIGHTGDQAGFKADYQLFGNNQFFIATISNGNHDLLPVRKKILELVAKYKLFQQ